MGLIALWHVGSSLTRVWTSVLCTGIQIPNYWAHGTSLFLQYILLRVFWSLMLGAYIFIIYVHQLGLGVQWGSNYQHKASLPCLLASQHMCTLWEQILSFSSPSICLTSQKGLSPPHKTSGLGCTLYGSTYLIPRVQVYLCKPSLPFRSVPRGRRPKPMFLSILPSYMVIFVFWLYEIFCQHSVGILWKLFHM